MAVQSFDSRRLRNVDWSILAVQSGIVKSELFFKLSVEFSKCFGGTCLHLLNDFLADIAVALTLINECV
jgi:hypothetical protein